MNYWQQMDRRKGLKGFFSLMQLDLFDFEGMYQNKNID
jgi:hypothetical protein